MKKKIIIICVLLAVNASLLAYFFATKDKVEVIEETNDVAEEQSIKEEETQAYNFKEEWDSNKTINDDYVCDIKTNLFSYPVVQAKGSITEYNFFNNNGNIITDYDNCEGGPCSLNDVYLRTNWEDNSYELGGSIFMDYRNTLDDQNIIIYGHHYPKYLDPERTLFFTPLEKLLEKENYEDNKYIELFFENESRKYEIVYVYIFDVIDDYDSLQYFRTTYDYDYYGDYDEGYYEKYINNMEQVKCYDTGLSLSTADRTLTLQTCVENSDRLIEIVVAKEIYE